MKTHPRLQIVVLLLALAHRADAQESKVESGAKARDRWAYLMSGWRAEREKLRTYELRVKGTEQRFGRHNLMIGKSDLLEPTGSHQVDLHLFRGEGGYKRSELHWGKFAQSAGTWVETPQYVAELTDTAAPVINLVKPSEKRQNFAFDFQPEAIGFCGAEEMRNPVNQRVVLFEDVERILLKQVLLQNLVDLGRGRYRAELSGSAEGVHTRLTVVINEAQGFTVEECSNFNTDGPDGPARPIDGEIHTEWTRYGDLWLPASLREIRRTGLSKVDLKFEWVSVNLPISAQLFDLDAMGAPKGTMIVDARLGRDRSVVTGLTGGKEPVVPQPVVEPSLRPSTHVILSAGILLTLSAVISGVVIWRRGHASSGIGSA